MPRFTMINLYQVMRRKVKSIFVSGEEFKDQEISEVIFGAFHSVTNPTLIIDCSFDYDKRETDLWSTLNRFSEKKRVIFIVGTEVAQSLQDKLQKYQAKLMHDREYTSSDLTTGSQNELLKNKVCFQGSTVSLNNFILLSHQ